MRTLEKRLLAAVLAGAVGAFAITAALGHSPEPQATTPVAVVEIPVRQGMVQNAEAVVLRTSADDRTGQVRRA
ncbi:hypothetical protein CU254_38370 [Amycolatopsis sp. AA4]|uniref:hypothetical protein n=1 Tax=Actinomycetes TaxID=1760 RepID=UPI0001B556A9|nr:MULTISPECIES: hypothetical protein [Actinomycetes]ATY15601.1 hypothetical protein CU254_38370 [Amycolatopsis sp. AA4]EFL11887.1 predicted protein [Streptomyces sp. AA4]